MKARNLSAAWKVLPKSRYMLVFDAGDDVLAQLQSFCTRMNVRSALLTAIGGFERATVAFFNLQSKEYEPIPVQEQVEVVSFSGNVTQYDGKPKIHVHCVLGHRDGRTTAGHLLEASVRPTLELLLDVLPQEVRRADRPDIGIPLIEL